MTADFTKPSIVLRVEGAAVLTLAVFLYGELGQSWIVFLLLFFVPDLSLLGYLRDKNVGAAVYNVVHTYLWPAGLWAFAFFIEWGAAMGIALIWAAHIGVDRLAGLGLKYPTGRKDTHLQRVV